MTSVVQDLRRYTRRVVDGTRRRLADRTAPVDAAPAETAATVAPATPVPIPESGLPHPLPDGFADGDIQELMRTFQIDDSPRGSLDGYWNEAYGRFLHTWGLVRDASEPGSAVLELGANPYFLTWLMTRFSDLELSLANFFGSSKGELVQRLSVGDGADRVELDLASQLFNMEEDRFPYDDDTFDVVLFCEIIEHLLMDPLHALSEINRVLRPGGRIVLTTPNVARIANIFAVSSGGNLYDPYSGFGPYGRHNREYTTAELVRLVEFAGFHVDRSFTADSNAHDRGVAEAHPLRADLAPILTRREGDLGQYIFVVATADHAPGDCFPSFLYRSWPAERMCDVP